MGRALLVILSLVLAPVQTRQSTLRVLQVTPASTIQPTDPVTVTFDRPVVGYSGGTIDPALVASVLPALPVRFDWRDPSTLRLVPTEPWPAGQVVTLTIDTSLVALDGSRLTSPERIRIRVTGPARRAMAPELVATRTTALPPDGRLRLLYTSAVDVQTLAVARYEFGATPECGRRTVPLRVVAQRPLVPEDYQFAYALGVDSARRAMGRVVELAPSSSLPDGCHGHAVIPSLDSLDASEIRYPITAALPFAVASLTCASARDCAASTAVNLAFTTPVRLDSLDKALRVDGEPAYFVDTQGDVPAWVVLGVNLTPGRVHRITFGPGLTDVAGRPLTGPREYSIEVGDRGPKIAHATGFVTQLRGAAPFIRVSHVNVDSIELELQPAAGLASMHGMIGDSRRIQWDGHTVVRRVLALRGSPNEVRTTDVPLPELVDVKPPPSLLAVRMRLRKVKPGRKSSFVSFGQRRMPVTPVDTMTTAPAMMQATGLAVHARIDEERGAVLVNDLRRGSPVGGATVTLRDASGVILTRARTDSSGVAILSGAPISGLAFGYVQRPARLIEVERAGDRVLLPVAFNNSLDGVTAGDAPLRSGPDVPRALLFTDRELYRPGDRVFLGAVARLGSLDRLRVPGRGERFRWHVESYGPSGAQVVLQRDVQFSRFGASADSFDVPSQAPVGYHVAELQAQVDGQWRTTDQVMFEVKEYRVPEFTITVTGDSAEHFAHDSLSWRLSGRYLYDAPMRGSTFLWSASITEASPSELRIPSLPPGFSLGDPSTSWEGRIPVAQSVRFNGSGTLDANGSAEIRTVDTSRLDGTLRVSFFASVSDVNRQPVTATGSRLLHGSSHYFAVRDAGRGWWRTGTPVRVEVLAVRPDGTRAAGESITARLIHTQWVDSSGIRAYGRWVPDTVNTWPVVSADTAISLKFTPRGGGYYTLQLTGRDKDGRAVESRLRRSVFGSGAWTPVDGAPTRLALEVDTVDHAVGSVATVRFDSPFESADAWVTLEREGLLRQFRQSVRGGPNEMGVSINPDMAPASLVGVVLLNRTPATVADSLHHRIRAGMARVRVDSMVKRLTVSVAPEHSEVEPGVETRMTLRVTDNAGRAATAAVMVWAVDEGLLSMKEYRRPDPFSRLQSLYSRSLALASTLPSTIPFLPQQSLQLNRRMRDSSSRLLIRGSKSLRLSEVVMTGVSSAFASSGSAATAEVREDFRITAFFRTIAVTDDSGRATVDVRLPDNITTYRVFAVAVGADDRSGSAESTFVATRPLVVRAAFPRFVRPGDTFSAGAAVGLRNGGAQAVHVETEGAGIALASVPTTTIRLDGGTAEARFSWTAHEGDSARVTLSASDGTNRDAVRVAIPVKPDRFPLARAVSGVVRGEQTVRLTIPKEVDLSRSRLTIRAGTTPLPLIDEALDYLLQYPYACTEQLLATGRVLIAGLALQRAGLPVKFERRNATVMLKSVIDQLYERQRADGAFGYWSNTSWSTPWLSSAVGHLLVDAAKAGVAVSAPMTSRLKVYLEQSLDSQPFNPDTTAGTRLERRQTAFKHYGERVAALAYLRRSGNARDAEELALLQRESLLAWEDRVLLAQLMHEAGRIVEARNLLQRAWLAVGTAGIRADLPDSLNGRGLFPSRVRPLARLVESTIAIDPTHARVGASLERLVSRTASGGRPPWNTQDYATASAAVLAAMSILPRGTGTLTASLGPSLSDVRGRVTLRTTNGAATDSTIDLTALAQPVGDSLVITVRLAAQNGPIFWALTTSEVSSTPDTHPLANGVTVERWYERFDNGEPATEVREGELVRVRVRVTVPNQRDFLAVEDPLPAGLEAVDLSLRTSGLGPFTTEESDESRLRRDREAAAGRSSGSWDSGWWSPWEHSEKRDDRVTWFARSLPSGVYTASYVARATTTGRFVRPPSRAEEMYNSAAGGRSEGGVFVVRQRR